MGTTARKIIVINKNTAVGTNQFYQLLAYIDNNSQSGTIGGISWDLVLRPSIDIAISEYTLYGGQTILWVIYIDRVNYASPSYAPVYPSATDGLSLFPTTENVLAHGTLSVDVHPQQDNTLSSFDYTILTSNLSAYPYTFAGGGGTIGPTPGITGNIDPNTVVTQDFPQLGGTTIDKCCGKTKTMRKMKPGDTLNFSAICLNPDNGTIHSQHNLFGTIQFYLKR